MFELDEKDKLIKRHFIRFLKEHNVLYEYKNYFLKYHKEYMLDFLSHSYSFNVENLFNNFSDYEYKFDNIIYLWKYIESPFNLLTISFYWSHSGDSEKWFDLADKLDSFFIGLKL